MKINIQDLVVAWVRLDPNALVHAEGVTILINCEKVIANIHHAREDKSVNATFKRCHFITNRVFAEEFGFSAQWDDMVKTGAYYVRVTPSSTIGN